MPNPPQLWYDRQGNPIDSARADKLLRDPAYTQIALTQILHTSRNARVSTVWLALDWNAMQRMGDPELPPILFETMVFGGGEEFDRTRQHWTTEPEACIGHGAMVSRILAAIPGATAEPMPLATGIDYGQHHA